MLIVPVKPAIVYVLHLTHILSVPVPDRWGRGSMHFWLKPCQNQNYKIQPQALCVICCIYVCPPVLMCWRASLRLLKPTASHLLVLSKYVVAMTGRVILAMFCSPQPEGWKIRLPIDFPPMVFSTSAPTCSLPACTHTETKPLEIH